MSRERSDMVVIEGHMRPNYLDIFIAFAIVVAFMATLIVGHSTEEKKLTEHERHVAIVTKWIEAGKARRVLLSDVPIYVVKDKKLIKKLASTDSKDVHLINPVHKMFDFHIIPEKKGKVVIRYKKEPFRIEKEEHLTANKLNVLWLPERRSTLR